MRIYRFDGARILIALQQACRKRGATLTVTRPREAVMQAFKVRRWTGCSTFKRESIEAFCLWTRHRATDD